MTRPFASLNLLKAVTLFAAALFLGLRVSSAVSLAETLPTSVWPMYQYLSDHNAVFDQPQWDVSWKADIGERNNGGLSIVGDTLYVESFDHHMYAFDALTGRQRWEQPLDDVAMATSLVDRSLVYAGSGHGGPVYDDGKRFVSGRPAGNTVYAFDRTLGRPTWQFHTAGHDMPSGVLVSDGARTVLIFHSGDEHVRAVDSQTGSIIWQRSTPGNVTMSSLALYEGAVYGISFASNVWTWDALAKNDAKKLANRSWTWSLRPADGKFRWISPYGTADCSPTVADDLVFVENQQFVSVAWTEGAPLWPNGPTKHPDFSKTTLYSEVDALSARTGKLLWKYDSAPGLASAAGSGIASIAGTYLAGTFYESLPFARQFAAFEGKTGKVRWMIPTHDPVKMGAVIKDGHVYFGDTAGYFYIVRATDGALERTVKFPDVFGCAPPVIVGNTLFITSGRTLYALRLKDLQQGIVASAHGVPAFHSPSG